MNFAACAAKLTKYVVATGVALGTAGCNTTRPPTLEECAVIDSASERQTCVVDNVVARGYAGQLTSDPWQSAVVKVYRANRPMTSGEAQREIRPDFVP